MFKFKTSFLKMDRVNFMVDDENDELSFVDDLIEYIRPPWHNPDEDRQAISERSQCLG